MIHLLNNIIYIKILINCPTLHILHILYIYIYNVLLKCIEYKLNLITFVIRELFPED